jgi:hypothetical protein
VEAWLGEQQKAEGQVEATIAFAIMVTVGVCHFGGPTKVLRELVLMPQWNDCGDLRGCASMPGNAQQWLGAYDTLDVLSFSSLLDVR